MVFAEVAVDPAHEFSEFFLCELVLFSKSLNRCVCFLDLFVCVLEKVHSETKTLVNKTRKVTDILRGSVQTLLSLGLSGLQFLHIGIELSLLL